MTIGQKISRAAAIVKNCRKDAIASHYRRYAPSLMDIATDLNKLAAKLEEFESANKPRKVGSDYFKAEHFQFVSDSQDVKAIHDTTKEAINFDSFFVKIGDGDYDEVWGILGIVPNNNKLAYRVI